MSYGKNDDDAVGRASDAMTRTTMRPIGRLSASRDAVTIARYRAVYSVRVESAIGRTSADRAREYAREIAQS